MTIYNLSKPPKGGTSYFHLLPYVAIVTETGSRYLYLGWLQYCAMINLAK